MTHTPIKTVIVEDEPEALDLLAGLIEATGLATVVSATTNPFEAIELLTEFEPDILFLDIQMPGMSGFDILNDVRKLPESDLHVVFTTAHDEFAIKAFDYAAFDYLLKPIDPDRLVETLQRHNSNTRRKETEKQPSVSNSERILIFKGITGVTFIDTDDVVYISVDGNYSNFHFTSGRVETVTALIGNIETHLGKQFFRTGRSTIINTTYLARIDMKQMTCVFIRDNKEYRCDISKEKVKSLMEYMKNRLGEN